MKKLLLILSLVASFASVSADPTTTSRTDRAKATLTAAVQTVKKSRPGKFVRKVHPVACKRTGYVVVAAVVVFAAKKAYDRYKIWKNKKADKTAE